MTNRELNLLLSDNFHNLKETYDNEFKYWSEDGKEPSSHTIYENVLNPYLIECIEANNQNELVRIFAFVEEILETGDEYAENVMSVTVIESVVHLLKKKQKNRKMLGKKSRAIYEELKKWF